MWKWKKELKTGQKNTEGLPYLNRPIVDEEHDWIGMAEYADYLKAAIDRGAEMIAVTADFGTGKSSLIQLLKKKCTPWYYRIFEVDLWCHLEPVYQTEENGKQAIEGQTGAAEIHKAFLYQLANQISSRLGDYVSKRMSENYGLLQLRIGHIWLGAVVVMGVICLGAGKIVLETAKLLEEQYEALEGLTGPLSITLSVLGVLCLWFVLSHSEILFSSKVSEGSRKWRDLDTAELFHNQILKRRPLSWWKRIIIIIEDLDRSNDMSGVSQFLKEMRKYYLAPRKQYRFFKCWNKRITFVVNIKQETSLLDEKMDPQLYPKVFDFILDLKKINIDNYDQILEGLLLEKADELQKLGLLKEKATGETVMAIPGMQWMIRGQFLDVREVKNRLNTALLLYASLCGKFGEEKISFEKCAVVSYVSLAFPEECQRMKDHTLDELMKGYLCGTCTEVEEFHKILGEENEEYAKEIHLLVQGHQIDGSYRTYFYNYPKGSHLRSLEEELVYNVILYPNDMVRPDDLEELLHRIKKDAPETLQEAFERLKALKISFPVIVLESPELFAYALKKERKGTLELIGGLEEIFGIEEAVTVLIKMLQFSNRKEYVEATFVDELCDVWNKEYTPQFRRILRLKLCEEFPGEILLYGKLFRRNDAPMNIHEINAFIDVRYILKLFCNTEDMWETESLLLIHQRILVEKAWGSDVEKCNQFYQFLVEAEGVKKEETLNMLLEYMKACGCIWESLEEILVTLLQEYTQYHEQYIELLNQIASSEWTEYIVTSVQTLQLMKGLSENACNKLWDSEMYPEYLYHMIPDNLSKIPFETPQVIEAYSAIETNLYNIDMDLWFAVRVHLICNYENQLINYKYLFGYDNPFPVEDELLMVRNIPVFLGLFEPEKISEQQVEVLDKWFGNSYRSSQTAFAIFQFLCRMPEGICKELFYKMDLQVVNYKRMAKNKKAEIRAKMTSILNLEDPEEAINYMAHIGEVDEVLERIIGRELQDDESLRNRYVALINRLNKPSKQTIANVAKITWLFGYCEEIEKELYEKKEYGKYVSSRVLKDKKFEIEEEKRETLWPTYVAILRSTAYGTVKTTIAKNREFLRQVMKQRGYKGMRQENRKFFTIIYQDTECLKDAEEYGEDFLEEYLSKISGFQNEDAAKEFLRIMQEHPKLRGNAGIYENVHGKLVSPVLKRKYTRLKNG